MNIPWKQILGQFIKTSINLRGSEWNSDFYTRDRVLEIKTFIRNTLPTSGSLMKVDDLCALIMKEYGRPRGEIMGQALGELMHDEEISWWYVVYDQTFTNILAKFPERKLIPDYIYNEMCDPPCLMEVKNIGAIYERN